MNNIKKITSSPFSINPRKISNSQLQQLKESLQEYGDISGIVLNVKTSEIIGGNQRSKIIDINSLDIEIIEKYNKPDKQGTVAWGYAIWEGTKLNYREVSWTKEKEKAANVLANKLGGAWDSAILQEHFTVSELTAWGFNKSELKWLNSIEAFKKQETETTLNHKEIYSKLGDVYQLDNHKIICGDATKITAFQKLMGAEKANACITDPPYNVNYSPPHRLKQTIKNDNLLSDSFGLFLEAFYNNTTKYLLPGSTWYIFHPQLYAVDFMQKFKDAGNYISQILIWVKNQTVQSRADYQWQHEPIIRGHTLDSDLQEKIIKTLEQDFDITFYKEYLNHQPIIYGWTKGRHQWNSNYSQSTVLNFQKPQVSKNHTTIKPVGLIEYLINNSTIENNIVVDPFFGSGSTLQACERTNRVFRGIEIEPIFVDLAIINWVNEMKAQTKKYLVLKNGKDITNQPWINGNNKDK